MQRAVRSGAGKGLFGRPGRGYQGLAAFFSMKECICGPGL
jgi:hypothetical protein